MITEIDRNYYLKENMYCNCVLYAVTTLRLFFIKIPSFDYNIHIYDEIKTTIIDELNCDEYIFFMELNNNRIDREKNVF